MNGEKDSALWQPQMTQISQIFLMLFFLSVKISEICG